MSENVMVVLNVFIVFGAIVFLIKTLSDNRLRQRVIEKGLTDDSLKSLFAKQPSQALVGLNAIKWGMVLIGIGLSVIGGRFFQFDYQEEMTWGLALVFSGIAFIIYYMMYKNSEAEEK